MDPVSTFPECLEPLRKALADDQLEELPLAEAQLLQIGLAARDASREDLSAFAQLLSRLLQVVADFIDSEDTQQEAWQIRDFVRSAVECLERGLQDDPEAESWMSELAAQAEERWGDCLQLVSGADEPRSCGMEWSAEAASPAVAADLPVDGQQIGLILGSLGSLSVADGPINERDSAPVAAEFEPDESADREDDDGTFPAAADDSVVLDPEIREAFLDDARRGLASIEAALLAYEEEPSQAEPLRQVCRELHTLKGASASVGLAQLAAFLHQVEDELAAACEGERDVDLQPIFKAVDAIRERMNQPSERPVAQQNRGGAMETGDSFVGADVGRQDSVRVKSAQLDRLMDMLAGLVMLRNRRESRVEQLKDVHNELIRCVSRLRAYEENYSTAVSVGANAADPTARPAHRAQCVSSLTEIANDLLELGGSLRELYEPIGDENLAISRFIRQFRQELIQLRRVPLGGLFQRLQRAARDAARVEGKKVRLHVVGEDVGLESSIQQQLYEPLLHIVRNAVSHGLEAESKRLAAGKSATGTVTLEAHGGANLLVITVRDDGRGLDYDALRRRGVEMGLVAADRHATRAELARLIFHPGFSTRPETNEISGRGVGMDVVATAIERMHSWVEVDSTPGEGTTVRLLIPLRSVIEHVMVFRAGGQEFGLPTQFVRYAGSPASTDTSEFPVVPIDEIFDQLDSRATADPQLFVLARGWNTQEGTDVIDETPQSGLREEQRLGVLVDEIVGPEEVVVRPLPSLLSQQRLFTGVTLSGTGDIMLLFDSKRLWERGLATRTELGNNASAPVEPDESADRRALVVDDSRSSRRSVVQILRRSGYHVEEAADGAEAARMLKDQSYDVVFTDLEMPQMNGMDLLREIRSNPRTNDLPVVIVSSRGEEAFRKRARELGVSDYLTKPVSEAVVGQTLTRLEQQQERTSV